MTRAKITTLLTIGVFLTGAFGLFSYLYTGTGSRIPLLQPKPYTVAFDAPDVDNLVAAGQVRIAGVTVGKVQSAIPQGDHAHVVLGIDDDQAVPLHQGASVRIGVRSLAGESYLDVRDGRGPTLAAGTVLPRNAIQTSTQLRDVLASLDPKTRDALGGSIRSLGAGTDGTNQDVSRTVNGLGQLGREGHTALDAIAAQSEDLRSLAGESNILFRALDTGQGQIATMVGNTQRIVQATAGQRQAVENTMRRLPGVLTSAQSATQHLTDLSGSLAPVAQNLKTAAPPLTDALQNLPATTLELRHTLTPLTGVLDRAPATLQRVPTFAGDTRGVIPPALSMMRDVNPVLTYLKPYGHDVAGFVANFNDTLGYRDEAGNNYLRLTPLVNERSVESPVNLGTTAHQNPNRGVFSYRNPFPLPNTGGHPGPFAGPAPRIGREPQ